MKIGYPRINYSVPDRANAKFALGSYTPARFRTTVADNLARLQKTLDENLQDGFLFFRIGSGTVPFASHSVCKVDWTKKFQSELKSIGQFVIENDMRISMHPGASVIINSTDENVVDHSLAELEYHADFLDAMELDMTAKIQIHAGGMYGNKTAAISSFIQNVFKLPENVRRRLVIENDDKCFGLLDCALIAQKTGLPVVFDSFHHACLSRGEPLTEAMRQVSLTWKKEDGMPMVDYSSQQPGAVKGTHADAIDMVDFEKFLKETARYKFDLMLEIRDNKKSAAEALDAVARLRP